MNRERKKTHNSTNTHTLVTVVRAWNRSIKNHGDPRPLFGRGWQRHSDGERGGPSLRCESAQRGRRGSREGLREGREKERSARRSLRSTARWRNRQRPVNTKPPSRPPSHTHNTQHTTTTNTHNKHTHTTQTQQPWEDLPPLVAIEKYCTSDNALQRLSWSGAISAAVSGMDAADVSSQVLPLLRPLMRDSYADVRGAALRQVPAVGEPLLIGSSLERWC